MRPGKRGLTEIAQIQTEACMAIFEFIRGYHNPKRQRSVGLPQSQRCGVPAHDRNQSVMGRALEEGCTIY